MMLDDLLGCDKCELDLCSSLQLQGIGPQRAGEENWQSRTCCNAQTPPPSRLGSVRLRLFIIYQYVPMPMRINIQYEDASRWFNLIQMYSMCRSRILSPMLLPSAHRSCIMITPNGHFNHPCESYCFIAQGRKLWPLLTRSKLQAARHQHQKPND